MSKSSLIDCRSTERDEGEQILSPLLALCQCLISPNLFLLGQRSRHSVHWRIVSIVGSRFLWPDASNPIVSWQSSFSQVSVKITNLYVSTLPGITVCKGSFLASNHLLWHWKPCDLVEANGPLITFSLASSACRIWTLLLKRYLQYVCLVLYNWNLDVSEYESEIAGQCAGIPWTRALFWPRITANSVQAKLEMCAKH